MAIKISNGIVKLLEARGLMPKDCRLMEISISPKDAMVIRFEIYITDDRAAILAEAFAQIAAGERIE